MFEKYSNLIMNSLTVLIDFNSNLLIKSNLSKNDKTATLDSIHLAYSIQIKICTRNFDFSLQAMNLILIALSFFLKTDIIEPAQIEDAKKLERYITEKINKIYSEEFIPFE